jgi:hypothetical protein
LTCWCTQTLQPPPPTTLYGPYLRFGGYDPTTRRWSCSALVVAHVSKAGAAPRLRFKDAHVHNSDGSVVGDKLDEYKGWCFWWAVQTDCVLCVVWRTAVWAHAACTHLAAVTIDTYGHSGGHG